MICSVDSAGTHLPVAADAEQSAGANGHCACPFGMFDSVIKFYLVAKAGSRCPWLSFFR